MVRAQLLERQMDSSVNPEQVLLVASVLLIAGVLVSKISNRLGVPALLLFIAVGMLAGSEGPGGIPYDDPRSAQFLGVVALAFILFAGGLDTDRKRLSRVLWQGVSLATVGVLITAILLGLFAMAVLKLSWWEGVLLGSIVSSTDAAAVFSILRGQRIGLKGATAPLLELESGSNDPMAAFLTLAGIGLLRDPNESWISILLMFVLQMAVGAIAGFAVGKGTVLLLNRLRLEAEGLYPVLTIGAVLLTYSATAILHGSGFLAVYIAGIVMGDSEMIQKRSLIRFHDGVAWLMQIAMFLALGLLVFPSRLLGVAVPALLISLFLIVVARPIAVFIALAAARLRLRQKALISWVGLRGAVPIVLATFPYLAGIPKPDLYFDVVFFIVLTSVLIQGTTLRYAARWLQLERTLPPSRQYPLEFVSTGKTNSDLVHLTIRDGAGAAGTRIMDLHLPASALVVLILRGDDSIAPRGATVLEEGDTLLVLTGKPDIPAVRRIIQGTNPDE
jgi:cell volume regulation protein A